MTTQSPPRRVAAMLTALAVAAGTLLLPTAAVAAEGPAPAPAEYRVIAGVHTDTVSTFLDDGQLSLGSKADVAEGLGTRFAADEVWFHVEDEAQRAVPAGYEFIAPAGSTVWLAPESNPGNGRLWPGFNTESIALGAIEGDTTRFTLTSFEGPGELEVYTGGGFEAPKRLWSSKDTSLRTFDVGRTHMHANWAFTAAGMYRLGVDAAVTVDGATQSASATYTFVVGPLANQVQTETVLSTSSDEITIGESATLTAEVSGDAKGYVEFSDGDAILGHEEVRDGTASLDTEMIGLGQRNLSATFIPEVSNLASGSTSEPVIVQVRNAEGELFALAGLESSYVDGDELTVSMTGIAQTDALNPRFEVTLAGESEPVEFDGWTLTRTLDPSWANAQIRAVVLDGSTVVARSAAATLDVRLSADPITAHWLNPDGDGNVHMSDDIAIQLSRPLAEGETVRLMQRSTTSGSFGVWRERSMLASWVEGDVLRLEPADANDTRSYNMVQVLREDQVVAQSPQFRGEIKWSHAVVSGIQPVYRSGSSFDLTVDEFYPGLGGTDHYSWTIKSRAGNASSPSYRGQVVVLAEGSDFEEVRHLEWKGSDEHPDGIPAEWNNWHLDFNAYRTYEKSGERVQVNDFYRALVRNVQVRELDPSEQLLFLRQPPEHYHSDVNTVALDLVGDPPLAAEDKVRWEWKWPGSDEWLEMTIADPAPELGPTKRPYTAEQAWNGVQVRAIVTFFGSDAEPMVTEPIAIKVDDHGRGPSQRPMVVGETDYAVGDEVTLTSDVQGYPTALEERRWERLSPGSDTWTVIEGETGLSLSFTAAAEDDGAQFRAAVIDPLGNTMYDPAGSLAIAVTEKAATAPAEPAAPEVTVDGRSVSVAWTAPTDGGSPLTGFTVNLVPASGDRTSQEVDAESTSVTFADVAPGSWTATVVAKNAVGSSGESPASEPVTVVADEMPTPAKPEQAPADRTGTDLGDTPAGGIELDSSTVAPGDLVVVSLGEERAETWVAAWLLSTPTLLGGDWVQVGASGSITVQIPADAEPGDHRLAVFAADGSLVGWAGVTVAQADGATPGDTGAGDSGTPGDTGAGDSGTPGVAGGSGDSDAAGGAGALAGTGGTVPLTASVLAVLLLVAGGLFVAVRRRRIAAS